jgi:hypothetical protein
MKNILLILVICISSLSYAQSIRERLDDIDFELEKLKMERSDREFNKQLDEIRRGRDKNNNSQFITLNDGTIIDVDKHLRNTVPSENICRLRWTESRFIKENSTNGNFTEIHIIGIPPLSLFFQNKNNNEIKKILHNDSNLKQMIKLCPILKNYRDILVY